MVARKRLTPEESRSSALEAARSLLIETGPQSVTLKAVSARIGRTHANLLHHFGSASGLQKALAEHLARTVCETILEAVHASRAGLGSPREVVDLAFDAFDREGAGALTSWMLLTGNEDALDPIIAIIHDMIDRGGAGEVAGPAARCGARAGDGDARNQFRRAFRALIPHTGSGMEQGRRPRAWPLAGAPTPGPSPRGGEKWL